MCQLPENNVENPNVLVGLNKPDDAGVYKINDEVALVQTLDYFTPIVDDPYQFGQIAAANALSDVYAMGGKPITALNIVGFPIGKLPHSVLADILRGAFDKVAEAGAVIIGGHSIDDKEPKFGMSVTGIVHPDEIWTNHGAKPGDVLILTKPIGVGIQTTGIKRGLVSTEGIQKVTELMATLNKKAAEVAKEFTVHSSTDITGFGLLGHLSEMATGSGVGITVSFHAVPILEGTRELAEQGAVPGGTKSNHTWLSETVTYPEEMDQLNQWILCDAITSGGLLLSVPAEEGEELVARMRDTGVAQASLIGKVKDQHPGKIIVE